jgi:hypothetical protein
LAKSLRRQNRRFYDAKKLRNTKLYPASTALAVECCRLLGEVPPLLAQETAAPYRFVWPNISAGTYALSARAVSNVIVKKAPHPNISSATTGTATPLITAKSSSSVSEIVLYVADGDPDQTYQSSQDLTNWTDIGETMWKSLRISAPDLNA